MALAAVEFSTPPRATAANQADVQTSGADVPTSRPPAKRARTGAPRTGGGSSGSRPEAPPPVTPRRRAPRGTALTFAGRRPPLDADKLRRAFLDAKDEFSRAYPKATETPRRAKRVGTPTDAQYTYLKFIQTHMKDAKQKRPPTSGRPADQKEALKNAAQAWVASFEAGTPRRRREAARVDAKQKKLAKKEAAARAAKERVQAAEAAKVAKKEAAQRSLEVAPKAGPRPPLRKKPAASGRGRGGAGRGRGRPAQSSGRKPHDPEEEAVEDLEPDFHDAAGADVADDADVRTSQPDDMLVDEEEPWKQEESAEDSLAEA